MPNPTLMVERQQAHISAAPPTVVDNIAIVEVHKSFGMTKALNGCNFKARLGEIHAIVGGNGCGKSTLAKVISGVLPIDRGQVSVLGCTPTTPHEARRAGIAAVFQEVLVADDCTIWENLYLGADGLWSRTIGHDEKYETAKKLMQELAGLSINPNSLVGLLPLNIKQWITIGRALLCKPRVLILDESSAALDMDSTDRLFSKMRMLRDDGAAIIIVTHRIAELIRICDRATVLRDGKDVGLLEKDEISEKNLLGLMTGRRESSVEIQEAPVKMKRGNVVMRTHQLMVWPEGTAVDFQLHQGEILGVTGLDGQGHSEFVRMLAGVESPIQSKPQVYNESGEFTDIKNLKSAVEFGVSYVSGDRKREGIFANMSIFENLLMPLYRRKTQAGKLAVINWSGLDGIFEWEVERLAIHMGERTNKITSLSGGNQQKVLIGRSFALNPRILILNDPARGIDVGAKSELYRQLRDYASLGKSIIYLSSEIEEFVGFCSRVLVFRNGSIFDEFVGNDIRPTPILEGMFGKKRPYHQNTQEQLDMTPDLETKSVEKSHINLKDKNLMNIYNKQNPKTRDNLNSHQHKTDDWKVRTSAYTPYDTASTSSNTVPSFEALNKTSHDDNHHHLNHLENKSQDTNDWKHRTSAYQMIDQTSDITDTDQSAESPSSSKISTSTIKIKEFNNAMMYEKDSSDIQSKPENIDTSASVISSRPPIKIVVFDDDASLQKSSNGRVMIVDFVAS